MPEDEDVRATLLALNAKYARVKKIREPHPDIGCWWTLYDYGLDTVRSWSKTYRHPYPGTSVKTMDGPSEV